MQGEFIEKQDSFWIQKDYESLQVKLTFGIYFEQLGKGMRIQGTGIQQLFLLPLTFLGVPYLLGGRKSQANRKLSPCFAAQSSYKNPYTWRTNYSIAHFWGLFPPISGQGDEAI